MGASVGAQVAENPLLTPKRRGDEGGDSHLTKPGKHCGGDAIGDRLNARNEQGLATYQKFGGKPAVFAHGNLKPPSGFFHFRGHAQHLPHRRDASLAIP